MTLRRRICMVRRRFCRMNMAILRFDGNGDVKLCFLDVKTPYLHVDRGFAFMIR